jgi:hypothetical protein
VSEAASITVRVPLAIRRRPGRKTVVTPVLQNGEAEVPTRADPAVVKALARAFRYQRLIDDGRYASISGMAAAERIERGYLGSLLRLTLLAPDIVEVILDGRRLDGVALLRLREAIPPAWEEQSATLEDHDLRWDYLGPKDIEQRGSRARHLNCATGPSLAPRGFTVRGVPAAICKRSRRTAGP